MCSIIGSSIRHFVLIILFQFYGSKFGLFEAGNLFWVGQYDPPPLPHNLYIGRKANLTLV